MKKACSSIGFAFFAIILGFYSCKKQEDKFTIGENANGGIVFYVDETGEHGLVCTSTDQSTGIIWGCYGTIMGTVRDFGAGSQNTISIVNNCSDPNIAAKLCNDLELNSFDDWFLPSIEELALMYTNLKLKGLGDFGDVSYWSSSESGLQGAWRKLFADGRQDYPNKTESFYVRAVRAF
jgi:hypothetical protein